MIYTHLHIVINYMYLMCHLFDVHDVIRDVERKKERKKDT